MITPFKGEGTSFAIGNLIEQAGVALLSKPGTAACGQISISPGGTGLSPYHQRLAESYPTLRTFVHADPGADNLPAPSPGEFDQDALKGAIEQADSIAVCWPASADDKTQTARLAKWIARMVRKSARRVLVVEATAEWHLHWFYFCELWRRKAPKVTIFGDFPARAIGAR